MSKYKINSKFQHWTYPDIPKHLSDILFGNNKNVVVVGVIGKSTSKDCNKVAAFGILDLPPQAIKHKPKEGQIDFYYNPRESILIMHLETTYDNYLMEKEFESSVDEPFELFHERMRCRFARNLMFLLHVTHIIVYVEVSMNFDPALLKIFRSLKVIRERYVVKFLPKLLRNTAATPFLGKTGRLCAARMVFLFENYPGDYEKTKEAITTLEFEVEDSIYGMLKQDSIVTQNQNTTLFSIHNNKQFVYYNTDKSMREDIREKCAKSFHETLKKTEMRLQDPTKDDIDELLPYLGFGRAYIPTEQELENVAKERELAQHSFMNFLAQHIDDAFANRPEGNTGAKSKNKFHFELLPAKVWFDIFKIMHNIFIENPDNLTYNASDADYKSYLENFNSMISPDLKFYQLCTEKGLRQGFAAYKRLATHLYSSVMHEQILTEAIDVYLDHARGPYSEKYKRELRAMCRQFWEEGRQQCEKLSLRGNPCTLPKTMAHDDLQHTSKQVFVSTCNCGRTQGRRDDPYTVRQANYEFYEFMAGICNLCVKVKKFTFSLFVPSSSEYREAAFEAAFPKLKQLTKETDLETETLLAEGEEPTDFYVANECSQPTVVSFGSQLSLNFRLSQELNIESDENESNDDDDSEPISAHEFLLQIKEKSLSTTETLIETPQENESEPAQNEPEPVIHRQASTTEYLPGLIHTLSAEGLLPLFPSWSLVCVGASSIYSHNVGLMEHFQSGFLSGANFLLPWDVHVRLQRIPATGVLKNSGKARRYRKQGDLIVLKIFIGFEYECPRGHRFMMCAPNKILRGGADIARDSSNQVVHNDMPLYYQCPCRSQSSDVAQLMRIHVVTPKAPVNVILNPKVCTGNFTFTLGLPTPPKLSQSAYWVLRLPYVYQGDNILIRPPAHVNPEQPLAPGYLMASMFGVAETEEDNETFFKK